MASSVVGIGTGGELLGAAVLATVVAAAGGAVALARLNWRGTFAAAPALVALALLPFAAAAVWPFAAAVLAGSLREYWRSEDIRKGQDKGRRARAAIGPVTLGLNARDRRRIDDGTRSGCYALGTDDTGAVTWLPLGVDQGRHTLVIGATGAGKTTTMLAAAASHVRAGAGLVVIDAKGDRSVANSLRNLASTTDRPFRLFTLAGESCCWNPLARGTASERADKLIAAEDWTETHYKRFYQRYLLTAFAAVEARGDTPDIAKVVELLRPESLAFYAREIDDEQATARVDRYLAELTDHERRDLAGLRNRVALLAEGEHASLLHQADDGLDLFSSITQGDIALFSLNASRYPETAQLLGAAIFQDLQHVVGLLEANESRQRPALIVVDEFGALDQDHVLALFQRARSAGLSLTLGTQELADLARVAPGFQDQVLGNVETVIAHRQNVPVSAELVAEIAGTRATWIHSFQTHPTWRGGRDALGPGNKHRGFEFVIAPDTVKQLGVGETIVITKNPHHVSRTHVRAPFALHDREENRDRRR